MLVCDWPHSVFRQNHLFVKMLFKQGFHYSEAFQMILHCFQDRSFQSPYQPSGRCVIPSGRPSVHCSIRPDDVPYHPDARQTKHHLSGPLLYREAIVPALHPSGCFSSPSGRHSVIDQLQILSKFKIREDCFNRPDDVDSRPNALIHKARIVIQISPSGRQSDLVQTRVHQLRKLPIRLQPSGRLPTMVRTRA
jgi:hypothetical protein